MLLTRAPLRVPIGGGGTDFPSFYQKYGGYILGFAIRKYVYVVLHKTTDKKYYLKYSRTESAEELDQLENRVAAEVLKYFDVPPGLEVATFSDVPESSGLGGSSAFCVALVLAVRQYLGLPIEASLLFNDAVDIERRKAKQPGGFQDQYFSALGGAHEMEFTDVFFAPKRVDSLIENLLPHLRLVFAGTSEKRLGIARMQESKTNVGDQSMVDGLLKVKQLGKDVKVSLESSDYDKVGKIFNHHWSAKKLRDPNITTPQVDSVYEEGLKLGATGGKLIGMGGGGYILFCGQNLDGRLPTVDLEIDKEGAKVLFQS